MAKIVYLYSIESHAMKTIFLICFLSLTLSAMACSGIPKSFCYVKTQRPNDHVISGVILSQSLHSINMRVLDVLNGIETRSVITIWDGTNYSCNGFISMEASEMGNIGDTIIAILPMISGVPQNTWDVSGDYRRPLSLFETAWLQVSKDTVRGYIFGNPTFPYIQLPYSSFKNYWLTHGGECLTLSIKENTAETVDVTITDSQINFHSNSSDPISARLYTIDARLISELFLNEQKVLDFSNLSKGIYLLIISKKTETVLVRKVIL